MVVRVNKTQNYTVMSNYHLQDENLSLKAKGLLSVVLSLPDDWAFSVLGLAAISKEKETSVETALKELKANGYLIITKLMPNQTKSGRIEYEWNFYEKPHVEKQETKKQEVENQGLEFQGLENIPLYKITNKQNTNKQNTDDISIVPEPKKQRFVIPTVDEVAAYCRERNNGVDAKKFVEYYEAGQWKDAKGKPVKNWKQKVITWEKHAYSTNAGSRSGGNEFTALLEQMEAENE